GLFHFATSPGRGHETQVCHRVAAPPCHRKAAGSCNGNDRCHDRDHPRRWPANGARRPGRSSDSHPGGANACRSTWRSRAQAPRYACAPPIRRDAMDFVFPAPAQPSLAIAGGQARFPLRRIYCIGRNYAEHAREMGAEVERAQPMFFMKPADAVVTDGADVPYPPATGDLHHELEMVVALRHGGKDIPLERALDCVYGYGVGLDLTRRDLQAAAKAKAHPWDAAKGFDASAPVSAIHPVDVVGHPRDLPLSLEVN